MPNLKNMKMTEIGSATKAPSVPKICNSVNDAEHQKNFNEEHQQSEHMEIILRVS